MKKMQEEWFSAEELAGLPGLPKTPRSIRRMATEKDWESKTAPVRGGNRIFFSINSLPQITQDYLAEHSDRTAEDSINVDSSPEVDTAIVHSDCVSSFVPGGIVCDLPSPAFSPHSEPEAPQPEDEKTDSIYIESSAPEIAPDSKKERQQHAWLEILHLQDLHYGHIPKVVDRDIRFAEDYCAGLITVPDWIKQTVKKMSRSSLAAKRAQYKQGLDALTRERAERPK